MTPTGMYFSFLMAGALLAGCGPQVQHTPTSVDIRQVLDALDQLADNVREDAQDALDETSDMQPDSVDIGD